MIGFGRSGLAPARVVCAAALALATVLVLLRADAAEPLLRDEASGLEYVEVLTAGAAADESLPVVLALHGLGDRPESFRLLVDDLPAKARVIVPRAPTPQGANGFSWFAFRVGDGDDAELAERMREAAERVAVLATSITTRHGGLARVVVCGFSQGGMHSFALAAVHPELVAAAVPVSGYLPSPLWPTERPKVRPLPKIFAFHGEKDRVIPLEQDRWSVEALRSNGYDAVLHPYPDVAHAISPAMRAELVGSVVAAVEELSAPGVVVEGPSVPPAASVSGFAGPADTGAATAPGAASSNAANDPPVAP